MTGDKQQPDLISRRAAILRVSAMLGGTALVGQSALLAGCSKEQPPAIDAVSDQAAVDDLPAALFSDADIACLDEIAETILPETGTPGAKAAGVGPFVALMVRDCYYPDDQQVFLAGLEELDSECKAQTGKRFMDASAGERTRLLETVDKAQQQYTWSRGENDPPHYFRMMKELVLLGYFTSEIGYNQAMRYAETPGRYDPCVPYEEGETSWADHA